MQTAINLTDDNIYKELKKFLHLFVNCEVAKGWDNNVPMPLGDHVLMHILFKRSLSTNNNEYDILTNSAKIQQSISVSVQLDFYGKRSGENAQTFVNLWRDYYGCENTECIQPLYCDEARLLPLINEAAEYENRYIVTATLQYNPVVTLTQAFIDKATTEAINLANYEE